MRLASVMEWKKPSQKQSWCMRRRSNLRPAKFLTPSAQHGYSIQTSRKQNSAFAQEVQSDLPEKSREIRYRISDVCRFTRCRLVDGGKAEMNEEKLIILPEDDAAASLQTVKGWVDRHGRFWGTDERMARYSGSTHNKCSGCGNAVEHRTYCGPCARAKEISKYDAMERKPWDGDAMLYSVATEQYFNDLDEVAEHCEGEGTSPKNLLLVICDPTYAKEIDSDDHFSDDLPEDGELPAELQEAFKVLNKAIRDCKTPLSWYPSKVALEIDAEGEVVCDIKPLPVGTLSCPRDKSVLHFKLMGGMRLIRRDEKGRNVLLAKCPQCSRHYSVHARAQENG